MLNLKSWMFGLASENLTKRLRSQAFKAMLHQEIGDLNFSIGSNSK